MAAAGRDFTTDLPSGPGFFEKNPRLSLMTRALGRLDKERKNIIFDKAEDHKETRTSIADKVAKSLSINCNRKLVRAVLDAKRSSKLKKLKKIS